MPPSLLSLIRITSRRTAGIPRHLAYDWQAGQPRHRIGAAIIDREAFDKAWSSAMPADAFNATHYHKEA
jgi:hypothetical protein